MKQCKRIILTACLLSATAGCQPPRDVESKLTSPAVESVDPPAIASTQDLVKQPDGVTVSLVTVSLANCEELQTAIGSHAGKIVIVDVWSTSCIPCMREFPHLVELSRKYPDQVACVSMNVDYLGLKSKPAESYLPKIEKFLIEQKAMITNFAAREPDEELRDKLGVSSIPAILIYGPEGNLIEKLTDSNSGDDGLSYQGDVLPKIEQLLAGSK